MDCVQCTKCSSCAVHKNDSCAACCVSHLSFNLSHSTKIEEHICVQTCDCQLRHELYHIYSYIERDIHIKYMYVSCFSFSYTYLLYHQTKLKKMWSP